MFSIYMIHQIVWLIRVCYMSLWETRHTLYLVSIVPLKSFTSRWIKFKLTIRYYYIEKFSILSFGIIIREKKCWSINSLSLMLSCLKNIRVEKNTNCHIVCFNYHIIILIIIKVILTYLMVLYFINSYKSLCFVVCRPSNILIMFFKWRSKSIWMFSF
jgi:hypothetical protein